MNDEAGSSSAVPPEAPPRTSLDAAPATGASGADDEAPSFYFSRKPRLQDLVIVLDRVTWLEIALLYFLDNSFIRFALRAMVQAVYLMPKPKGFPEQNVPQPYVGGVLGTNLLCLVFHLFNSPPEAGEATRGYLHGSLLIDFIGQQGPTSKLRLVLLDIVILLLQFLTLAVTKEKTDLEAKKDAESPSAIRSESNNQDHDAEERGEIRGTSLGTDGIELQDLGGSDPAGVMQEVEPPAQSHTFALSDNIASGRALIGEFYLVDSARLIYRAYEDRRREQRETDARVAEGGLSAMNGLRQRLTEQLSSRVTPG